MKQMLNKARHLIVNALLELWRTGRSGAEDSDSAPVKSWNHMLRHLPGYLAEVGEWESLFEIADSGFFRAKSRDPELAESLGADYALLFDGCCRTKAWLQMLKHGEALASFSEQGDLLKDEHVAQVLARASGDSPALFDQILSWEALLPSPEERLRVLLSMLESDLTLAQRERVILSITRVTSGITKSRETDLLLRGSFTKLLSLDPPELPICVDVLWDCLFEPRLLGHVGDLGAAPHYMQLREPRSDLLELVRAVRRVPESDQTKWLTRISDRVHSLSFAERLSAIGLLAREFCRVGSFEQAARVSERLIADLKTNLANAAKPESERQAAVQFGMEGLARSLLISELQYLPERWRHPLERQLLSIPVDEDLSETGANPMVLEGMLAESAERGDDGVLRSLLKQTLVIARERRDPPNFGRPLRKAADICLQLGDKKSAIEFWNEALISAHRDRTPNPTYLPGSLVNLAALGYEIGGERFGRPVWDQAVKKLRKCSAEDWKTRLFPPKDPLVAYCDFAQFAHKCGASEAAQGFLESALEAARNIEGSGEPRRDEMELNQRLGTVVSAWGQLLTNRDLLGYMPTFHSALPEGHRSSFIRSVLTACLKLQDTDLARRWMDRVIEVRLASTEDRATISCLADMVGSYLEAEPAIQDEFRPEMRRVLDRWDTDPGQKFTSQAIRLRNKLEGADVTRRLVQAETERRIHNLSDQPRSEVARLLNDCWDLGLKSLVSQSAERLVATSSSQSKELDISFYFALARAAHSIGLADETQRCISSIMGGIGKLSKLAERVPAQIKLAGLCTTINDYVRASATLEDVYRIIEAEQQADDGTLPLDALLRYAIDPNAAAEFSEDELSHDVAFTPESYRRINLTLRRARSEPDLYKVFPLLLQTTMVARNRSDADSLLQWCSQITEKLRFEHDKIVLKATVSAGAANLAWRFDDRRRGDALWNDSVTELVRFRSTKQTSVDTVIAMMLCAMVLSDAPHAALFSMFGSMFGGGETRWAEDFFFAYGLRQCLRACLAAPNCPDILKKLTRIEQASVYCEDPVARCRLECDLALGFRTAGQPELAFGVLKRLRRTLEEPGLGPRALSSQFSKIAHAFLLLEGEFPKALVQSLDSAEGLEELVHALQHYQDTLPQSAVLNAFVGILFRASRVGSNCFWSTFLHTVPFLAKVSPSAELQGCWHRIHGQIAHPGTCGAQYG